VSITDLGRIVLDWYGGGSGNGRKSVPFVPFNLMLIPNIGVAFRRTHPSPTAIDFVL
jgi:hypothetical protein